MPYKERIRKSKLSQMKKDTSHDFLPLDSSLHKINASASCSGTFLICISRVGMKGGFRDRSKCVTLVQVAKTDLDQMIKVCAASHNTT